MTEEMDRCRSRICEMESAIAASTEDGLVYEDEYVQVERAGGRFTITGKPIRSVFFYAEDLP